MPRWLDRLTTWIESLNDTIRPAVYGALLIVLFMLMKGAWIVAPLAIIYVLVTSDTPGADLLRGTSVVALAMLGGALSGLSYGLIGRHLRHAFPGGRYLTGMLTMAPYMFVLTLIIRVVDHEPVWRPLTAEDLWISTGMAGLFGAAMGHIWFAPGPGRRREKKRPT